MLYTIHYVLLSILSCVFKVEYVGIIYVRIRISQLTLCSTFENINTAMGNASECPILHRLSQWKL